MLPDSFTQIRNFIKQSSQPVEIVAASKTQPVTAIQEAFQNGITHFGENRVEEAMEKIPSLPNQVRAQITWHMIGHLQTRKVKNAVLLFDWIQSVDSLKLAQKINLAAQEQSKKIKILIQVNNSGEESKSGYAMNDWQNNSKRYQHFAKELLEMNQMVNLQLKGLMTIAPQSTDSEDARPYFRNLKLLQQHLQKDYPQLNLTELSMGMTEDYQVAIQEGATMIRLGRAIFGERKL